MIRNPIRKVLLMSKKLNCILCQKEYETCNCGSDNHTWKVLCDTSNHYQIHLVLSDYNHKNIDAKQAFYMLSKLDITGYENWNNDAKKMIEEILEYNKKDTLNDNKKTKNIQEEIDSEQSNETPLD